ncbi:hypothetical protein L1887_30333 [Cichorium endivia]|nr:hypothetical protein L1887_30333 [Cichorium endivia]
MPVQSDCTKIAVYSTGLELDNIVLFDGSLPVSSIKGLNLSDLNLVSACTLDKTLMLDVKHSVTLLCALCRNILSFGFGS